ncbi:MAG: hypothetical protein B9S32_17530 [Verrucomicrobia bacterium Tous-C9LFEB]|nr:MAG: hypothetical protein B9S32_17530 [Verrucomicrobia bacterium Tous-C9LFEB]
MSLSAVLIVKNEEENLPRCLRSLEGVCQEIVVVDTGSTDGTVALAQQAGARVSFFPWNGNESDARNYSVQQATGDWLLVIDADEELSLELNGELRELMPELMRRPDIRSGSLIWENHFDGNEVNRTRILRLSRREGFRFDGDIHPTGTYQPETHPLRGALHHFGYQWTPERRERKAQHILNHLKPYLQKPHPAFGRWCQYLTALNLIGEETHFLEMWSEVAHYTPEERIASESTPSWLENSANFFRHFACKDDFTSAAFYADEILSAFPRHATSRFYRLQGRVKERRWKEVLTESQQLLEFLAHDPGDNNPTWAALQCPTARAWQWLAERQLENPRAENPPAWLIDPITLPTFLFGNRAPTLPPEAAPEGAELLKALIEAETLDRCHSGAATLRQLSRCLQRWPHLNWFRMGLDKLERGESFRLETLAHRTVHLV